MSTPPVKQLPSLTTFEFTKRKRWADLLIHELSEAIVFVLSSDAHIWFCGRAVIELLGWSDAELIDRPFTDLVNPEDQRAFHVALDESLRTRAEMNSYVRLKARSPITSQTPPQPEILFEVKGCPYFIENELTARCIFAVAKPYPSRNIAMLNTFLELKVENERLQGRLAELRLRAPSPSTPIPGPSTAPAYTLRSLAPTVPRPAAPSHPSDVPTAHSSQHPPACFPYDSFGSASTQLQSSVYESLGLHAYSAQCTSAPNAPPTDDDLGDDTLRRKKLRKSHNIEQFVCVTCGRTDSPEWRKGPQGPKTLCNACGLRWAKEIRNKVDENGAAGSSNTANNA